MKSCSHRNNIVSNYHCFTLSLFQVIIVSRYHWVILVLYHVTIVSYLWVILVFVSRCHCIILLSHISFCITLSLYHTIAHNNSRSLSSLSGCPLSLKFWISRLLNRIIWLFFTRVLLASPRPNNWRKAATTTTTATTKATTITMARTTTQFRKQFMRSGCAH